MSSIKQTDTWTVGQALQWLGNRFKNQGFSSAKLEAQLLLAHALNKSKLELFLATDQPLSTTERECLRTLTKRRLAHEPIAYILGYKDFLDFRVAVGPGVLIPRPETEFIITAALDLHARHQIAAGPLLDLGTGSGVLAIALAKTFEQPVLAIDCSPVALQYAEKNLRQNLGLQHSYRLLQSDWLQMVDDDNFALVVSNPPYVAVTDRDTLAPQLHWEPQEALFSGNDGLTAIIHLASKLGSWLQPQGWWICEVGFNQRQAIDQLLQQHGWYDVVWWKDYAGIDRIFAGRWSAKKT